MYLGKVTHPNYDSDITKLVPVTQSELRKGFCCGHAHYVRIGS